MVTVTLLYIVSGKPVERFLTFLETGSQKAEVLLEFLEKKQYVHAVVLQDQTRLRNRNPAAVCIPCAA